MLNPLDPVELFASKIGAERPTEIRAQEGAQEAFLSTEADIAVYGGAAGSGKSFALLMEALRHTKVPGFGAVIFRRTYPQITNEGGLWDTSAKIYIGIGGVAKFSALEWTFPPHHTRVRFAHMQHEDDRYEWDGAQVPLIGFDQLEHFTKRQFFYMLSRNRTACGVRPYIRATCNPADPKKPDQVWLRELMKWWIDRESGYPIPERSGVIRYFLIDNDEITWSDSKEQLAKDQGVDPIFIKSFTFIPGLVYDNQILLRLNPEYLANLRALQKVDRERLLAGNWNVSDSAGSFFQRNYFQVVDAVPALVDEVRYWDRAGTPEEQARKGSSHTAGLRMGVDSKTPPTFFIRDVDRFQGSPLTVETRIKNVSSQDGMAVRVGIEQDPGQAGKAEAQYQVRNLAGHVIVVNTVHEDKGKRAKPASAQAEAGNVKLLRGAWNEDFLREAENFDGSDKCVSDQIDAFSGAMHLLTNVQSAGTWGR